MSNKVVLSFHDTLLHQSDIELLRGPYWLNDTIISFYFEYLGRVAYNDFDNLLFVSPEVTQCLKMVGENEISLFLDPLDFVSKDYALFALNDNDSPMEAGGSHWSLLVYSRGDKAFYHFDSMQSQNYEYALKLCWKLNQYLKGDNEVKSMKTPPQCNGYDCGVHLLYNAELIVKHVAKGKLLTDPSLPLACDTCVSTKRSEIIKIIMDLSKEN